MSPLFTYQGVMGLFNPQTTQYLHDFVTAGVVPGMSYAMIQDGKIQTAVWGQAQLVPHTEPLRPGMLYDVASLTKVIGTTTVILELMAAGQVDIDVPVQKYLPQFRDHRVTLRHLLTHTSNLQGYIPHRDELTADQLITALYDELKVGDGFGHRMVYADVGLILAGQVIEQIYHMPVQEVITQRVLTPLQMTHSTFTPNPDQCVPTELSNKRGRLLRGEVHDPKAYTLKEHCGSAGLFANLDDMITFAQWMMDDRVPHPVLAPALIDSLYQDWTPNHRLHRSLGWDLRYTPTGRPVLYHTGYTGTVLLVDKPNQSALIVLTNRVHPTADNHEFIRRREILVGKYLKEETSN